MRDRLMRQWRTLIRERANRQWRELSLDTVDELACHLSELQESSTRRGASDEEARQIALDALNAASFLELSNRPRARHGGYLHDLRVAVRQLIGTPVVTTVAILSLALGIGANTAIFSLVNSLVLRALPVKDPHRLAILTDASAQGNDSWTPIRSVTRFGDFRHAPTRRSWKSSAWSATPCTGGFANPFRRPSIHR